MVWENPKNQNVGYNMNATHFNFAQIGKFLEYPHEDFRPELLTCAQQIEKTAAKSAENFKEFYSKIKRLDLEMWQEYYVQTFDLTPHCPLYLSVHLFGEESFKRSELMTGLKMVYARAHSASNNAMTELPDHLAVILKNRNLFSEDEWSEFLSMCLLPTLDIMIKKLEKNSNPYSLILKAIQELLVGVESTYV